MNNKGISLVTVIVIIIVMIIIATISIIAGNKLILDSKNLTDAASIESIKEAVNRLQKEAASSGIYTPKGESFVGKYSPAIGNGDIQAVGWYLLAEDDLLELGVRNNKGRYLVNYQKSEVLDMSDSTYVEKYNIVEFMYEQRDNKATEDENGNEYEYVGLKLTNKSSSGDGNIIYKLYNDTKQTEVFGTGWYYVSKEDLPEEYANYVTNSYLINYDNAKYVMVTSYFERES